jgi:hypothetical protein
MHSMTDSMTDSMTASMRAKTHRSLSAVCLALFDLSAVCLLSACLSTHMPIHTACLSTVDGHVCHVLKSAGWWMGARVRSF